MAKGTAKRASKTPSSAFKPSTPNPPISTSTSSPITYPPFHPASPPLLTFLSAIPPTSLYILHLDTFPPSHKKNIFLVPLLLNTILTLLLLWRASFALPTYLSILAAMLGFESRAAVNVPDTPWRTLMAIGARRAGMFFLDFALVRVVAIWPRDFFLGGPLGLGPLRWRLDVGFKEKEVVVRRSRGWWVGEGEGEGKVEERVYKERERVAPVVEKGWVQARTGYGMMDRNWDLYFKGMVDAHRLVGRGELGWEEFERKVVVWTEGEGWLVWEVGRLEREEEREGEGGRRI